MRRIDARDPVADPALGHGLPHLVGDVADGQAACGSELVPLLVAGHAAGARRELATRSRLRGRGRLGGCGVLDHARVLGAETAAPYCADAARRPHGSSGRRYAAGGRARSSAGQSSGLIIRWSLVRIQAGPTRNPGNADPADAPLEQDARTARRRIRLTLRPPVAGRSVARRRRPRTRGDRLRLRARARSPRVPGSPPGRPR